MTQNRESGQTLIVLLAFMTMAITLTSAAVVVTVASIRATSVYSAGQNALSLAESGADNAIMRLIRDASYSGETLTLPEGVAIISVTGSAPTKTIISEGVVGDYRRKIQVVVNQSNNAVSVTSWSEVP
ncbi:MAG TPA: hypothetical protein VLA77_01530 [Candidatus Saccharimonadales bacterium]|nr:hypothetical protein [Candidatus Saccharimonadales bacterium]